VSTIVSPKRRVENVTAIARGYVIRFQEYLRTKKRKPERPRGCKAPVDEKSKKTIQSIVNGEKNNGDKYLKRWKGKRAPINSPLMQTIGNEHSWCNRMVGGRG